MKNHSLFTLTLILAFMLTACGAQATPAENPYGYDQSNQPTQESVSVPTETMPMLTTTPTLAASTEPSAPMSGSVSVDISGFAFKPADLTLKVGAIVTWTNNDSVPHKIVADDGSFSSQTLNEGDTFVFTFNAPGVFLYHCSIHSRMKGVITVVQ